ncbi:MAG TPA: hypothetical protein VE396_12835 [Xanthobacteraceae bacterium]|nr:hypothetical protein [Xanthobacteraceae bacterium]
MIEAVTELYSGTWRPGEDPPDAYVDVNHEVIAVEISTLAQHVTSDVGTRVRLSDDQPAVRLADDLNKELQDFIPTGTTFGLHLSSPIVKFRKTKARLTQRILALMEARPIGEAEVKMEICGNDVSLWIDRHGDPQYKKVSAVISNRHSSPDILQNATYALDDRITTKSKKKCLSIKTRPIWLGLFNDYWLAEAHTYIMAMKRISTTHCFDRILMVSGDKSVSILYDRLSVTNS